MVKCLKSSTACLCYNMAHAVSINHVTKVPSKQSKLQFQPSQKSKYSVKSIILSFISVSIVTSKDKNVTNSFSENNVISLCETSPCEKISFSNSATPVAQPSLFSSRDFFSSNVDSSSSISSATEAISISSNILVASKPSDLENITSEKNDEIN